MNSSPYQINDNSISFNICTEYGNVRYQLTSLTEVYIDTRVGEVDSQGYPTEVDLIYRGIPCRMSYCTMSYNQVGYREPGWYRGQWGIIRTDGGFNVSLTDKGKECIFEACRKHFLDFIKEYPEILTKIVEVNKEYEIRKKLNKIRSLNEEIRKLQDEITSIRETL